jgi:hypothetical protein
LVKSDGKWGKEREDSEKRYLKEIGDVAGMVIKLASR